MAFPDGGELIRHCPRGKSSYRSAFVTSCINKGLVQHTQTHTHACTCRSAHGLTQINLNTTKANSVIYLFIFEVLSKVRPDSHYSFQSYVKQLLRFKNVLLKLCLRRQAKNSFEITRWFTFFLRGVFLGNPGRYSWAEIVGVLTPIGTGSFTLAQGTSLQAGDNGSQLLRFLRPGGKPGPGPCISNKTALEVLRELTGIIKPGPANLL